MTAGALAPPRTSAATSLAGRPRLLKGRIIGLSEIRTPARNREKKTSRAEWHRRASGPPLHVHRHETEIFYILEGLFEITLGDRTVEAPAGAMAVGPRDIPHTFRNVGPTPGKLLLTVIPGRFSDYFLEVDGLPDRDLDTIKALTAKYDVEILE